jgi:FkbM family methyltransferase
MKSLKSKVNQFIRTGQWPSADNKPQFKSVEHEAFSKARKYERSMPYISTMLYGKKIIFAAPNEKCAYFGLSIKKREPKTNEWILNFAPGEIFFDIGANNGIYGLMAAMLSDCKVYAFEPHFASYYVMGLNIYANKLQDQMLAYPLAISDRKGYGSLFLSGTNAGKSLNHFGESRPHEDPIWNAVTPQAAITTTIDEFVAATGVTPNHIKVDVDGLEPEIVDGGLEVLANKTVKSIMLELDLKDEKHVAVFSKLSDLGFKDYEEDEAGVFFYR